MKNAGLLLLIACTTLPADIRLPAFDKSTLPNGAVLQVMARHDVPLVTIRVAVRGGMESEPSGLRGIASVVADAVRRGTAKRTADQFADELDFLGATIQSGVTAQSINFTLELLSKDVDKGLELLSDALLHPSFTPGELQKLLAERIDAAKGVKDNPGFAASEYVRGFFYGPNHPYGNPVDELSLGRIKREDVLAFHKNMFVGKNMVVTIVGDIDAKTAAGKASAGLAGVTPGVAYEWKKVARVQPLTTRVAVIDKPDATQTNFLIALPGIDRTHPDRVPLWVVNTLFGGRFTSMLNEELRINSGLTYGANSRVDENRLPGRVTLSTFTKTETTAKALDMTVGMLGRIRDKGITPEQLASAKAYLKGIYPTEHLETADQLSDVLTDMEMFGLNRGEVDDLFSRIDAVTVEQANEVAKRYYSPDRLTIVLLGNAAKFEGDLKKYAPRIVRVPITNPGLTLPLTSASTRSGQ